MNPNTICFLAAGALLLSGCPGTIQTSDDAPALSAIASAIRVSVVDDDGETLSQYAIVTSRSGACATEKAIIEETNEIYQEQSDLEPVDWSDAAEAEAACERSAETVERWAAIYSRRFVAGSWYASIQAISEGGYLLEPGSYGQTGDGGFFSAQLTKVESNPYADYRNLDVDCAEWAEEISSGSSPDPLPQGPSTEELYEDLDNYGVTAGDLTVEEAGDGVRITIEGGELSTNEGRPEGEFDLDARLTDCEVDAIEYPSFE